MVNFASAIASVLRGLIGFDGGQRLHERVHIGQAQVGHDHRHTGPVHTAHAVFQQRPGLQVQAFKRAGLGRLFARPLDAVARIEQGAQFFSAVERRLRCATI